MKQNNIKIAVTGGIGSGKSLACDFFGQSGYPVFSCDKIYAELLERGSLQSEIVAEFGEEVINADLTLNREKLSQIVFDDKERLAKLNKITHGKIFEEAFKRAERYRGIVFFEVPLLFEGGYEDLFDGVVVVLREESQRILSVVQRDGVAEESVKKRIKSQFNYNISDFAQYYVIHNAGNIDNLRDIASEILSKITKDFSA